MNPPQAPFVVRDIRFDHHHDRRPARGLKHRVACVDASPQLLGAVDEFDVDRLAVDAHAAADLQVDRPVLALIEPSVAAVHAVRYRAQCRSRARGRIVDHLVGKAADHLIAVAPTNLLQLPNADKRCAHLRLQFGPC